MSRRHADNWSHLRHYLVDPYTPDLGHQMVTVMVMNDLLPPPLCNVNRPSHSEIQLFQNLTMKIHGQGHVCGQRWRSCLTFKIQSYGQGQTHWSHLRPGVQSICLLFCFMANGPLLAEIYEIPYLTLKIQGQGHGQTWWSHLRPWVQSICLLFVSWQSDHFWLRYSKFYIWPWKFKVKVMAKVKPDGHIWALEFNRYVWKFKVKVMAKVKPDGHIWALEFNRYVCFSFPGNWTIFGWDIANSIFDLEKSRSRSRRKSTKI